VLLVRFLAGRCCHQAGVHQRVSCASKGSVRGEKQKKCIMNMRLHGSEWGVGAGWPLLPLICVLRPLRSCSSWEWYSWCFSGFHCAQRAIGTACCQGCPQPGVLQAVCPQPSVLKTGCPQVRVLGCAGNLCKKPLSTRSVDNPVECFCISIKIRWCYWAGNTLSNF